MCNIILFGEYVIKIKNEKLMGVKREIRVIKFHKRLKMNLLKNIFKKKKWGKKINI